MQLRPLDATKSTPTWWSAELGAQVDAHLDASAGMHADLSMGAYDVDARRPEVGLTRREHERETRSARTCAESNVLPHMRPHP